MATHFSDTLLLHTSTSYSSDNSSGEDNVTSDVTDTADVYNDVSTMLWHIVSPTLLVFGTFGNVMTVMVMRGMPSSQSTACLYFYFTVLALSDQCSLSTIVTFTWVNVGFSWPPSFFRFDLLCSLPKFTWNVSAAVSAWVLVAMTYQRVISVIAPHRVGILCTVRRGKLITTVILILACALHVSLLLAWKYWPEYRECQYNEEFMPYADLFQWLDTVFTSILPFLWLGAGNCVLVWQVIKSSRLSRKLRGSADQKAMSGSDQVYSLTRTLIVTSAAFLMLTLPIDIFDAFLQHMILDSQMLQLVRTTTLFLWISAAGSNFYLYVLSGRKFREETAKYLCCRNRKH